MLVGRVLGRRWLSKGRQGALSTALKEIESQFGKGSIMQLGDQPPPSAIDTISTGSLALDRALGIGGLPRGRVVEIYGPESSGKTTLALHAIAQAQKRGMNCTFIDVEHALDTQYAQRIGVDVDGLFLSQPDAGEAALGIADTLVRSGAMDIVVVDSVAALVTQAELRGDMGDHHMAVQARLMSQALRKLNSSLAHSSCLIIFINQIRSKVGVMFGSPEVTSGGNALKFYASVRLDIRRTAQLKDGSEIVGSRTRVKVIKNKLAPPFREAEFDMTFGSGISRAGELVDLGVEVGLLKKAGAWYSWTHSGDNIGQGKEKTKAFFLAHPEEADKLEADIRAAFVDVPAPLAVDVSEDGEGEPVIELDDGVMHGPDPDDTVRSTTVTTTKVTTVSQ